MRTSYLVLCVSRLLFGIDINVVYGVGPSVRRGRAARAPA